ncbi:MAG: TlpA family protein disulfide reductase [Paucibacter sp.]|nr:TlpA family protein disulfide reductase [Roseateles sp.]
MKRRELLVLGGFAAAAQLRLGGAEGIKRDWPKGRATPALALPGFSLASARGTVVLLNFWASWCPPCRDELPSLELLEAVLEPKDFKVVAINYRETDAALKRFLDQMPSSLSMVRDADGTVAQAFGVHVFPTSVLIGRDGRAIFTVVGGMEWNQEPARGWIAPYL